MGKQYYVPKRLLKSKKEEEIPDPEELLKNSLSSGVKPPTSLFVSVMKLYAREGDVDSVYGLFVRMQKEKIRPDVEVFTQIVTACANSRPPNPKLANEALQAARQRQITFSRRLYEALVLLYANSGDRKKALSMFADMISLGFLPSLRSFHGLIIAHGKGGKIDDAFSILDKIKEAGLQPSAVTFTTLLMSCSSEMSDSQFEFLNQQLIDLEVTLDRPLYAALITIATKKGLHERALSLFREMKEREISPTTRIYTLLFQGAITGNQPALVRSLIKSLREDRVRLTQEMYGMLILFFAQHDVQESFSLLEQMSKSGLQNYEVLVSMIAALPLAENYDDLYDNRHDLAEALTQVPVPSQEAYETLILLCLNDITLSHFLFLKLANFGYSLTPLTASKLMASYVANSDVSNAQTLLENNPDNLTGALALVDQSGMHDLASLLLEHGWSLTSTSLIFPIQISDSWSRICRLVELFLGLNAPFESSLIEAIVVAGGKQEKYLEAVDLAFKLREVGHPFDSRVVSAIIQNYCLAGMPQKAKETLQMMIEDSFEPSSYTFSLLIKAFLKAEEKEEAKQLIKEMTRRGLKPNLRLKKMIGKIE